MQMNGRPVIGWADALKMFVGFGGNVGNTAPEEESNAIDGGWSSQPSNDNLSLSGVRPGCVNSQSMTG